MDHILASEVLVVVLQVPEGLTFREFRRLFHSTHGYPLDLARYGYSSLQRLLDDMKDLVAVVEAADQEPQIACRSIHQHTYIFLGENEISPEIGLCSAQAMENPSASNRPRDVPGLREVSIPPCSSHCLPASEDRTPASDVLLTEKWNTNLEKLREDCNEQQAVDDLQQPNSKTIESTKPGMVVPCQEGIQKASELLANTLSTFATGLQLQKLKKIVKNKHGTDLEELSRSLGCVDVLHLLQHLPNIRLLHPSKPAKCVVRLQGGLGETSLSSSQCSFVSGVRTPSSDAFLAEEKDTLLKEDCSDQATLDDLQRLNSQSVESAEASHYVVPQHKVPREVPGSLSSSQCCPVSEGQTPASGVVLFKKGNTNLKEPSKHWNDEATVDSPLKQQQNIHNSKPSDGCKKSNYEKKGAVPSRSQSAAKTSKSTALTSRPLPCNSSAIPGSIHPQNSIHIKNTPRQSFRKHSPLTNQTESKAKSKPARRNAIPTKSQATKESLFKNSFKIQKPPLKQTAADQLSKSLVVTHHNHQHQEKSYTPHVSRLRTAALSYSSVASQNIAEAPVNKSPLNNPPAPYPTSIHYIDASNTQHSAPNFSPPISDFPHLSEKTKNGSYCSRPLETEHLLAPQKNGEELKNNILCVLEAHPKGMSLFQFQNTYRSMFHHMLPLNGYTTVKQMLEEMKEVVRMEDLEIQCWLFPVSSHAVSSQRMDQEFGLQNQPVSEQPGHSIDATMSTANQLKNKLQNEFQHKPVTSKALLHNSARNLSKPAHQGDLKNTCGPQHPIGTATVCTEHTSSQLNQTLDNETLKHIPFPQLLSNEFPPLQHLHTQNNTAEQLSTNKCTCMQEASIAPLNFKTQTPYAYSSIVKGNNEVDLSSNSISANLPATTSFSDEQLIASLSARSENHSHPQLSVPTADPHHLSAGRQDNLSYRETAGLVSDAPPKVPTCAEELKSNIFQVLTQHPDGMSIFQFTKMYRFMFNHIIPLEGYSSVKQLLLTIPDVVKTRGLGVQMLVFPFSSDVPCCQVILEENGLSLSEMETVPYPTEQDSALRNTTSPAKMPLSLNSSPCAKGVAAHALSISSEPSASFHPRSYALNPEASAFSPSSTMCFPQFPSVDLNGVSTPVSMDISGDNCHTPSVPNFHAQCHTLISDCTPNIAQSFNDPSTSLLTSPSSSFKSFFTNSGADPSSVVEQSAISSECHNERVSSEEVLSNDYKNQQARTWSQVAKCEDSDLLTDVCFVQDTAKKKGTLLCPKKTRPQKSKTNQPVQFVGLFTDLHSTNGNNSDMFFFGSKSEKPSSQI